MSVPPHELDLLRLTVEEATDLASQGRIQEGYESLEGGLYRAEELTEEGAAWGGDLLERWQEVVRQYRLLYGGAPAEGETGGARPPRAEGRWA